MGSVTFDQIRGPIERIILVALGWLAAKGYISPAEVAGYATLVIGILAAVYGWWQNRPKAVIQSAAAVPGTTVVTTAAIAAATPEANIVSNAISKVVTEASVVTEPGVVVQPVKEPTK